MERGFRTSVVEVFQDFNGRRAAIIQALTTESEEFYQQCNPDTENDLCLYGLPNETWEVNLPAEEIPPELPEPLIGINFARDGMERTDWLAFVAVHSDAWLLALASYYCARFGFDKNHRNQLFGMINDLPTIFEVVKSPPIRKGEEKASASIQSSRNKPKSSAFSCWAKLRELCIGALGFRKPKTSESDETESGSIMEVEWDRLKEKIAEEEDKKQNGEVLSRDWEEGKWEEGDWEEEEEDEEEVSRSNKRARSE